MILFREATVHYNMGQYALAADKYLAAIRADPTLPGPYRNLGLTYRAMGKCNLALPHYRQYLLLRPEGGHAVRVKEDIARCVQELGQDPSAAIPVGSAYVTVRGAADNALIYVDGVQRGTTPILPVPVQPGRRVVTILHPSYLPWHRIVEVASGESLSLDVELKPAPNASQRPASVPVQAATGTGRLRLIGLPRRTEVSLNGSQILLDRDGQTTVLEGRHMVEVSAPGLVTWRQQVSVEARRTVTVAPLMEPTPEGRTTRRWAWGMTATGAALGIAGVVLGVMENRTHNDIRDWNRAQGSRSDLDRLVNRRRDEALAANILYGISLAALGTGAVLFLFGPETRSRPAQSAGWTPGAPQ